MEGETVQKSGVYVDVETETGETLSEKLNELFERNPGCKVFVEVVLLEE